MRTTRRSTADADETHRAMPTRSMLVPASRAMAATTKTAIELELTPLQATAHYTKLVLTVDSSTYLVQKSVVTDAAGNANEFTFSNVKTGVTIPDSTFKVGLKSLANKNYKVTRHTGSCPTTTTAGTGSGSPATGGSGSDPATE